MRRAAVRFWRWWRSEIARVNESKYPWSTAQSWWWRGPIRFHTWDWWQRVVKDPARHRREIRKYGRRL